METFKSLLRGSLSLSLCPQTPVINSSVFNQGAYGGEVDGREGGGGRVGEAGLPQPARMTNELPGLKN